MRIRLSDPSLLPDLRQHFERSDFVCRPADADALEVTRPDAPDTEQERREVELHLGVWRAMHPGVRVEMD